jgi:hypothetical protein
MTEPIFSDPLEKYQFLVFRWVIFIIFVVTAFEILDKHIHVKAHARKMAVYMGQHSPQMIVFLKQFISWGTQFLIGLLQKRKDVK